MGRQKKYASAGALEKAVRGYFDSISRLEPVLTEELTDELDSYGHRKKRLVEVVAENGETIRERVYYIPPERYGLCDYLGISIDTWDRYGGDPKLQDVVTWAEDQIKGWESKELRRRENKRTAGLIHAIESAAKSKKQTDSAVATPMDGLTDAQLLTMVEGAL